jgi:hypothetical protein
MKPHQVAFAGLLALVSSTVSAETEPSSRTDSVALEPGVAPTEPQRELTPPELAARDYLTAVRDRGFAAQADFVHPDEMARFQQLLVPVFEAESKKGGRGLLNATFGREAAIMDVSLASPDDFMRRFARVMAVRMPDQPVGFDELVILGIVEEGDLVHVLARLRTGKEESMEDRLEVVSLAPYEGGWKVVLSPGLERAVWAMKRQVGGGERTIPRLVPRPPPLEEIRPQEEAQPTPVVH